MEKSWVWWLAPVIPAMAESLKQEDHGPDLPRQNVKPFLQNN
jgi:hypothetical protein